ncbi:phage morphogenesis protein [Roseibium aggregatum]|uniref:phage morphogenesis protein n=1 Tax=Roseibium aggregatum TaxID=187304 RepID=UPI001E2CBB3D|nr:phage morphogenesis protein [Roseibium aggregatum]UES58510.1 phage morphogenesis protein [Roseibium aggregatum]
MAGKSKSLKWFGKAVKKDMRDAQVEGINRTMGACVNEAKANHDWQNRTATLEGSIDIADYAHEVKDGVKGTWGSRDVVYALIHETGGIIRPKNAKALAIPQDDGSVRFVKSVEIKARPYLRPAADNQYPKLAGRIKTAFNRRSKKT